MNARTAEPVQMPRIGASLADGRFAGISFDPSSDQDVALVDLGASDETMTHAAAKAWAAAKGGDLATREEARILWANIDMRFPGSTGWFWLATQSAGGEAYAWYQYFSGGDQYGLRKGNVLRARAVRRLPLQPFGNSAA